MAPFTAVPDFTRLRVAVVGDLIADHYVNARPGRLSREAPVMVLRHAGEQVDAGGAANVACNVWALGARTRLVGALGRDAMGDQVLEVLTENQVDVEDVLRVEGWTTPTKTRILAAEPRRTMQQLLRIDREPEAALDAEAHAALCDRVASLAGEVDALLVVDHGYGSIDDRLLAAVRTVQEAGAMATLDPCGEFSRFRGLRAITVNAGELAQASGRGGTELDEPEVLARAAHEVLELVDPAWLLVTLGNRGMALFSRELPSAGLGVAASGSPEVLDVSGAGDTASATFTLALAAGLDGPSAMRLANAASGVVVMERGTAVCSASRLRAALPKAPVPAPLREVLGA